MKKNIVASLILVIGMASLVVGCGSSQKDSETEDIGATTIKGNKNGGTTFKSEDGEAVFEKNTQEAQKIK